MNEVLIMFRRIKQNAAVINAIATLILAMAVIGWVSAA